MTTGKDSLLSVFAVQRDPLSMYKMATQSAREGEGERSFQVDTCGQ